MATGLLASVRPAATTETVIYTVPASYDAVVNLKIANTNATGVVSIRLGIQATAGAFASKDYIYYDYPLPANGDPIELTGISLTAGNSIRAYVNVATVNFHVNGIESPI